MPTFNLPKLIAKGEILKHLPVGAGWYTQEELTSGETSKIIDAITGSLGLWLSEVKGLRKSLFLAFAVGEDLDSWGADLGLTRRSGESDATYRARLQNEIIKIRATKASIISTVESETGLETEVFEPWRYQSFRGNRDTTLAYGVADPVYGRSGKTRTTSLYWMGGVIDVHTQGFSPLVQSAAQSVTAAGVRIYLTPVFTYDVFDPDLSATPVQEHTDIEREIFVRQLPVLNVRSGGNGRSGNLVSKQDAEITRELPLENMQTVLYDNPEFAGPWSVYDNALSWENLQDYTWDSAIIDGHSSNPHRQYLNELVEIDAPQVYQGTRLYDNPEFSGPYTVYDTPLTWQALQDYTWDAAAEEHEGQGAGELTLLA